MERDDRPVPCTGRHGLVPDARRNDVPLVFKVRRTAVSVTVDTPAIRRLDMRFDGAVENEEVLRAVAVPLETVAAAIPRDDYSDAANCIGSSASKLQGIQRHEGRGKIRISLQLLLRVGFRSPQ